jgi:AcrR family transcriptional regulator
MAKQKELTRPYSSLLRNRQQEITRKLILDAVASLVAEGRLHAFSIQDVANRAGISYASVYRHFPTRESLLEAMYEWANEVVHPDMPASPQKLDDVPAWLENSIPVFERYAAAHQAAIAVMSMLNINPAQRQKRDEQVERVVNEAAPQFSPAARRRASAVIRYLASSQAWASLRQRFGLDAADTSAALGWALRVLIREINQTNAYNGADQADEEAEK